MADIVDPAISKWQRSKSGRCACHFKMAEEKVMIPDTQFLHQGPHVFTKREMAHTISTSAISTSINNQDNQSNANPNNVKFKYLTFASDTCDATFISGWSLGRSESKICVAINDMLSEERCVLVPLRLAFGHSSIPPGLL